eukprot:jgi/Botrbrau1/22715/Bobra.0132s0054.1
MSLDASSLLENHQRYTKMKMLGAGGSGLVALAYDKHSKQTVAIKFVQAQPRMAQYIQREVLNHKELCHPHIVAMKEVFVDKDCLAIVMEYAPGGDLHNHVSQHGAVAEPLARWYFQQIIMAVHFCHLMGLANRDIKLENILISNTTFGMIKLCDFGYSKHEYYQSAPDSKVGTPEYLSPEVVSSANGSTYDGKAADIWACAVVLFALLTKSYPFRREEDAHLKPSHKAIVMLQRILQADYKWPDSVTVSPECQDLIGRMLVLNPEQRLTSAEIQQHPFFLKDLPQEWYENQRNLCEKLPDLPGTPAGSGMGQAAPPWPHDPEMLRPQTEMAGMPAVTQLGDRARHVSSTTILEGTRSAPAASLFPSDMRNGHQSNRQQSPNSPRGPAHPS